MAASWGVEDDYIASDDGDDGDGDDDDDDSGLDPFLL